MGRGQLWRSNIIFQDDPHYSAQLVFKLTSQIRSIKQKCYCLVPLISPCTSVREKPPSPPLNEVICVIHECLLKDNVPNEFQARFVPQYKEHWMWNLTVKNTHFLAKIHFDFEDFIISEYCNCLFFLFST